MAQYREGSESPYGQDRQAGARSAGDREFVDDLREFIVTSSATAPRTARTKISRQPRPERTSRRLSLPALPRLHLRAPAVRGVSRKWLLPLILLIPLLGWIGSAYLRSGDENGRRPPLQQVAASEVKAGAAVVTDTTTKLVKGVTNTVTSVTKKVTTSVRGDQPKKQAGVNDARGAETKPEANVPAGPKAAAEKAKQKTARSKAGKPAVSGAPTRPDGKGPKNTGQGKGARPIVGDIKVVYGDTLRAISVKHYGDELLWPLIWDYNRARARQLGQHMVNPDLIYPGWTFVIPPRAQTK